jgi:hypothetical protein
VRAFTAERTLSDSGSVFFSWLKETDLKSRNLNGFGVEKWPVPQQRRAAFPKSIR